MSARAQPRKVANQPTTSLRLLSRPLESLVFLLPLILFYEIGCLILHTRSSTMPDQERVVAFHLLQLLFQLFGSTGVWMPGLAVIIILLCTQAASGQPWLVRRKAVALMYAECALLAVPLLAFNHLLRAAPVATGIEGRLFSEVVLGIGAGVYEELVFRLILISLIVLVGTDLLRLPARTTLVVAVLASAAAFSAHHHPPLGGEPFAADAFLFRSLAGVYLGALFVWRGFGPAAGTHAAYNLLVTLAS